MDSSDLTFGNSHILLDLLKYCSVFVSQKMDIQLKGPSRATTARKMSNQGDDHETSSFNTNPRRSSASATLLIPDRSFFQTIASLQFHPHYWRGGRYDRHSHCIRSPESISRLNRDSMPAASDNIAAVFKFRRRSSPRFQELVMVDHIASLTPGK